MVVPGVMNSEVPGVTSSAAARAIAAFSVAVSTSLKP